MVEVDIEINLGTLLNSMCLVDKQEERTIRKLKVYFLVLVKTFGITF